MKAFGLDSTQAFDLVASGYKNGLNYSDDFMDTLNEYAPLFASAGYSAQDMLGILQNGMENGAMNTDKTADAVKELQIRLADGSMDKVMDGFSDNTKQAFQNLKNGQGTVKDVASSIQEDLKKLSPHDQQKALSSLSTQFEDLGIKGALSLFDIKGGFDNVGGAMDSATEKDPAQEWQSSWNTFSTSLQQIGVDILTALQPVLDFFADMAEKFNSLPEPLRIFIEVVGGLIAIFAVLAPILGGIALLAGGLEIALLPLIGIVLAVIAVIALIVVVIQNWGAIVDWLKGVWDAFAGWIGGLWDGIGQTASKVWNWIKDTISGVWDSIKNGVSNAINSVKNTMSGAWDSIKNMTKSAWDGLKSMITTPINAAKDIVSGIIDKIKGLFNFKLKFPDISIPHIPMPHFSISGNFNPLKGQIPKIGIDWFANGGILTRPTVFGQNGNNLMVGGEAGKEAVAPLSDLMAYVQSAVRQEVGGMSDNFAQMIQLLTIIASKDMNLNMDGKAVSQIVDNHFANNQAQLDFGIGRT